MTPPVSDSPASSRRTNLVFGIVLAVMVLLLLVPTAHDYWGDHKNHFEPIGDLVGPEPGQPFANGAALVAELKAIVQDEETCDGMNVFILNGDPRPQLYSYCTPAEYRRIASALETIRAAHVSVPTDSSERRSSR